MSTAEYEQPAVVDGEVVTIRATEPERIDRDRDAARVPAPTPEPQRHRRGDRSGVILAVPVLAIGFGELIRAFGPWVLAAAPAAWGLVVLLACWGARGQ